MSDRNKHKMDDDELMNLYGKHFSEIKKDSKSICPDAELINNYFYGKLPEDERVKVEEHIDRCPICLAVVDDMIAAENKTTLEVAELSNWPAIEKEIDMKFYSYLENKTHPDMIKVKVSMLQKILNNTISSIRNFFQVPRLAYAGALAVLIIICLYTFTYINRPDYFPLADIQFQITDSYRTSTNERSSLSLGMKYFMEGNLNKAQDYLNNAIDENPTDLAANFYMGLTLLLDSKKSIPGLTYNYNKSKVQSAIDYLNTSLSLSENNVFYQEDCYWLLGKANIMLGKLQLAKANFQNILKLNEPNQLRKGDAKEIIAAIEKLKN